MTRSFGAIRAGVLGAALCAGLAAAPQLAKAEDTFKFGGVFTLSGPASFLGLFEEAAVRLAVEQFMKGDCIVEAVPPQPCEGGGLKIGDKVIPIEWTAYDDVSEDKKSIDAVIRLVEQDEARAIWGPRMNSALLSAASILDPQGNHQHLRDLLEPGDDGGPQVRPRHHRHRRDREARHGRVHPRIAREAGGARNRSQALRRPQEARLHRSQRALHRSRLHRLAGSCGEGRRQVRVPARLGGALSLRHHRLRAARREARGARSRHRVDGRLHLPRHAGDHEGDEEAGAQLRDRRDHLARQRRADAPDLRRRGQG